MSGNQFDPNYDNQLIELAKKGDKKSYDKLAEKVAPQLNSFAERLSPQNGADIVQETLFKGWKGIEALTARDFDGFCRWMYRIAANSFKNHCKKQSSRINTVSFFSGDSETGPFEPLDESNISPSRRLSDKECRWVILEAIDQLPPKEKEVMQLEFCANLPTSEIAIALDIAIRTVQLRLVKARIRLLRELKQDYDDGLFDDFFVN